MSQPTHRRPATAWTDRAALLVEGLNLEEAAGVPGARWELFQLQLFLDRGTFRIDNKSRQIAWSFAAAADGMADAILAGRDAIYVSINQREAQEKIRYALAVYEHLEIGGLPKIKRQTQQEIELDNGARLTSLPAQKPRGRARANLYLDEFAHVPRDGEIYTAALPITSKGGRIRIGSSPFGAAGRFWEIFGEGLRPYPGYTRSSVPWWSCYSFCTDPARAIREAPGMETAQRVEAFGNERIRAIFENIPIEDFQQEYECLFIDESRSWITWDEIRKVQEAGLVSFDGTARPGDLGATFRAIEGLRQAINEGQAERAYSAGLDIGRTRNTSELFLIGLSTAGQYPLRLRLHMDALQFDDQVEVVERALARLPITSLVIDQTGIGRMIAETLSRGRPHVSGVDFTNPLKTLWATQAKKLIGQGKTPLPVDKDLAYQIHSIKRIVSPAKNLIFDTESNEKHHADQFWAWALALSSTQAEGLAQANNQIAGLFNPWARE